jgi:hypothetical protein
VALGRTNGTGGVLRRALGRLAASREELDAVELRQECVARGATPVASVPDRMRGTFSGTVRAVTLQPVGGVPALEAELYDGSASVILVWLGRRQIAGIEPGCALTASGLIATHGDRRVVFNPRYELRPAARERV